LNIGLELDELLAHSYDDENSLAVFMEELKSDVKVCDFLRMRLEIVLRGFEKFEEGVEFNSVNKLFISRLIKSEVSLINGFKEALRKK
jgi:hypothetical protein